MADTQRSRSQLIALLADNVTGQISEQDVRDLLVTLMEVEFANPGDFWAQPRPINTTTDKSARGWMIYSQTVSEACSFMNVLALGPSGAWLLGDAALSARSRELAMAMDSYVAGYSQATLLKRGVVYHSAFSATWSGNIGKFLYLMSGVQGSISYTITANSVRVVGLILPASDMSTVVASGKFFFDPYNSWAVAGT
jgi:hypothetical protein